MITLYDTETMRVVYQRKVFISDFFRIPKLMIEASVKGSVSFDVGLMLRARIVLHDAQA